MKKKWFSSFLVIAMLLAALFQFAPNKVYAATVYYVSFVNGDDSNYGTSPTTAWKTLSKVSNTTFSPGDCICLECGSVWHQGVTLNNSGTTSNPITLTSYGSGPKPKIMLDYSAGSWCVSLSNTSGWNINNIEMCNAEHGIYMDYETGYEGHYLHIANCYFHDITLNWVFEPNTITLWGAAITKPLYNTGDIYDIQIHNCVAENCDGFFQAYQLNHDTLIDGCTIYNNRYNAVGALQSGVVQNCVFSHNGGQCVIPNGGTDIILSMCDGVTVQYNEFGNRGRYQNDPDGCGVDYEMQCLNTTVSHNFFHDIAASGVFIFKNPGASFEHANVLVDSNLFYHDSNNYSNNYGEIFYSTASNPNPTGMVSNNTYYTLPGISFAPNGFPPLFTVTNNNPGTLSFVNTPTTSIQGGIYNSSQSVSLSCSTYGATIRYTLDGSLPTSSSTQYTGTPITISETTCLNVKAFYAGMENSATNTQIYRIDPLGPGTQLLSNGGFETPAVSTYQYGPMTYSWTFNSTAGVQHNGSAWMAANASEGVQTAFLQGNASSIQQSVSIGSSGYYKIFFKAAKRSAYGGTQSLNVYYDNTLINSYTPVSNNFSEFYTDDFYLPAGSHTIKFTGTAAGDNTDFIDNVVLWKLPSNQASVGFSSTQGANQWYYQSKSGSTYTNMVWNSGNSWWNDSTQTTCIVGSIFQHPQTSDSARVWVAPHAGYVQITCSGNIRLAGTGGDGIVASVNKNSSVLWGPLTITDTTGVGFTPMIVQVAAGDSIYFIVNKNSTTFYDTTYWDPIITYTDAPAQAPGITVSNGGFETPAVSTYQYGPMTYGWTFDASSGVQRNGSAWGAANAPEGVQTAFVQVNGSIQQSIYFPTDGNYKVCFKAAKRAGFATQILYVYYDSTLIGTFATESASFSDFITNTFTASSGYHTIRFTGIYGTDRADFIDDVKIIL